MELSNEKTDQLLRSQVDECNQRSWDLAQSDPRAALEAAEKALQEAERAGYIEGRAAGLLNSGWSLIYTADYEGALKRLHESLDIYESLSDVDGKLKVLNALGVIAHRVGDSEKALERYRETLEISRSIGNRERLLAALNNLGELSASLHHDTEARAYYEEAHEVAQEVGNPSTTAIVKVNLGGVLRVLGEDTGAQSLVEEGIALARGSGDSIAEAEGLTTLGIIFGDAGAHDEAEHCHMEALALAETTGHPPGIINVLNNLGTHWIGKGNLKEARRTLHRASELSEKIGTPLASLSAYVQLAEIYEEAGELKQALAIRKRLYELQRRVSGERALMRMSAMRTEHELERSRAEAEIFRLTNVELREKTDQLEAVNNRMELISEIAREITASLDLDELTELLYERVNGLMDASVFGIALYDESEKTLDYALFIEESQHITPFVRSIENTDSFGAWAVRNRKEIVIGDAGREYKAFVKRREPLTRKNSKSLVFLPLTIENRVVGVLTVQSQQKRVYSEEQVELLRALGAYIAIALDNSRTHATIQHLNEAILSEKAELERAYDRIAHMANHDNLTQLPNRRLLNELLNEHIPLARRQRRKFGLLYLDLDDFKPVNDTFGHAIGDTVLVRVAERLRSTVRSSDTVARIGGDEFVLLVRDIDDRGGLETIAQKVLDSLAVPIAVGEQICTLGASVGASIFPRDGETCDALLNAADRAMYQVKQHGKFGVMFADTRQSDERTKSAD